MTRILLQYLLPLLAPLAVYLLWLVLARRAGRAELWPSLEHGPWFWLIIAGVVLAFGGLAWMALSGGSAPGGTYEAPRWEDGRMIPGRVVKPAAPR